MKTTNISVSLNTPDGRKQYTGRGIITYPFVIHRPIANDWPGNTYWCVSHIASGRKAFNARTIQDAKRMVSILGQFDLFKMPECDRFYELCRAQGRNVQNTLENEGWSPSTMRFRNV
jgi:hypothetical protein